MENYRARSERGNIHWMMNCFPNWRLSKTPAEGWLVGEKKGFHTDTKKIPLLKIEKTFFCSDYGIWLPEWSLNFRELWYKTYKLAFFWLPQFMNSTALMGCVHYSVRDDLFKIPFRRWQLLSFKPFPEPAYPEPWEVTMSTQKPVWNQFSGIMVVLEIS